MLNETGELSVRTSSIILGRVDFLTAKTVPLVASEVPENQVLADLKDDQSLEVFPKTRLTFLPQLSTDHLNYLFGLGKPEAEIMPIKYMKDYLLGYAVLDEHNECHDYDPEWQKRMEKKYGAAFQDVWYHKNQFRLNKVTAIDIGLQVLARNAEKQGRRDMMSSLIESHNLLRSRIYDHQPQYKLMNRDQKSETIQLVIDQVIQALWSMSTEETIWTPILITQFPN